MRLHRLPEPGQRVGLLGVGRRQVVAQHLAARIERVGIEDQRAVAIIDAGAAAGRLHQRAQDRRRALGIDGEFERVGQAVVVGAGLALLLLEQFLGIELHLVGVDAGRGGDGAGDDLALRQQALHLGIDQAGAELVEIEDARDQDGEPDQIEHDDAPRQAGEAVPEGAVLGEPAEAALACGRGPALRLRRARSFSVAASGRCQDLSASAVMVVTRHSLNR